MNKEPNWSLKFDFLFVWFKSFAKNLRNLPTKNPGTVKKKNALHCKTFVTFKPNEYYKTRILNDIPPPELGNIKSFTVFTIYLFEVFQVGPFPGVSLAVRLVPVMPMGETWDKIFMQCFLVMTSSSSSSGPVRVVLLSVVRDLSPCIEPKSTRRGIEWSFASM